MVQLILILDVSKVGAWICTGWDKCIRKVKEKEQLEDHYRTLADKGMPMTKAAAKSKISQ